MIFRINTLLYSIKLDIKLLKAFRCRQSMICKNDISKAKFLPFSQIKTLLLETLKEELYINTKLVKSRSVIVIGIIVCLNLTR